MGFEFGKILMIGSRDIRRESPKNEKSQGACSGLLFAIAAKSKV